MLRFQVLDINIGDHTDILNQELKIIHIETVGGGSSAPLRPPVLRLIRFDLIPNLLHPIEQHVHQWVNHLRGDRFGDISPFYRNGKLLDDDVHNQHDDV